MISQREWNAANDGAHKLVLLGKETDHLAGMGANEGTSYPLALDRSPQRLTRKLDGTRRRGSLRLTTTRHGKAWDDHWQASQG